ncbi:MAG: ABC transporter ATP-binding protein [Planctomycetaceae bacterium]
MSDGTRTTAPDVVASVRDVSKVYELGGQPVKALDGVSIDFRQGDFVAIMGSSGSGKSTLLNLLGCLDRPTSGQYVLAGRDVARLDDEALSRVRGRYLGFVFQSYNLIQQLTVVENIEVPLAYRRPPLPGGRELCLRLAKVVGLSGRLDHRPNQLSGGQQQRVAIARALVNHPSILMGDEPTGNLDSRTGRDVIDLFRRLNREQGLTVIIVTYDGGVAAAADRVVTLRDGLIVSDEPAAARAAHS